jgi:hypothetical protein
MQEMMRQRMGAGAGAGAGAGGEPGGMIGGGPGAGALGGRGGPGGGGNEKPSYENPFKAATTFLNAVKAKDAKRLTEAVALRSKYEARSQKHRDLFSAILEENADQAKIDELAEAFDGMNIIGANDVKSSGMRGIIVGKTVKGDRYWRTLFVRHEANGWKIQDFSDEPRVVKSFKVRTKTGGGTGGTGGGGGNQGSY